MLREIKARVTYQYSVTKDLIVPGALIVGIICIIRLSGLLKAVGVDGFRHLFSLPLWFYSVTLNSDVGLFPMAEGTWLQANGSVELQVYSSDAIASFTAIQAGVEYFHRYALEAIEKIHR